MKERYYDFETIDSQAERFLQRVRSFREMHRLKLYRNNIALLILDMQRYFLDNNSHAYVPSGETIILKIKRLKDAFLRCNLPVIQTRHLNTTKDAGCMEKWWRDILTVGNPLSAIVEELEDNESTILNKTQYDAFFNTNLEKVLKTNRTRQIVITGVMTHLCCETTARSAFVRGFEVLFPIDATATYNREFHIATLLNLSHGVATPVLTEELLHLLDGGKSEE